MSEQLAIPEAAAFRKLDEPTTPMQLLAMAVSQNLDMDKLAKLMDLQERWEKNEARKAYVEAMTAFKSEQLEIRKNKHVKFGNTEYDHATLDNVVDVIVGALSKYGLSHGWQIEQTPERIKVTCKITHRGGHSESVTLESGADTSGSKNSIQAIASALTYLERYTLLAATGMAPKGADNDGATWGELAERVEWIENCRAKEEKDRIYKQAFKDASERKDAKALLVLLEASKKWDKEHRQ